MSYLESLRVFVRVVELGSITAGGRDMRLSPAVASNRIKDLENRFGVRLLNRTTRRLTTTEIGRAFYDQARRVIETLDEAEAVVGSYSGAPRGVLRLTAPLGLGRRLIAPLIPAFCNEHEGIEIRLRLSDRSVNIVEDGIDLAYFLGEPADSALKWRKIADCPRLLVAAPDYLKRAGTPAEPDDLIQHECLLLRFPRSTEYFWTLETPDGPRKMTVAGRFDADDGDVLTDWALAGHGIANRPSYEVADHITAGRLVEVLPDTRPVAAQFGSLTPHRRLQDPKVRLFADFAARKLKQSF
ncbi:LysR family transcriptional regulator [Paracoccus sp. TK19116]|uniref:LysR family transcriptional regulator n=1 Tax=Paracoccus albicereus TaxID=2922394 RepID=A0ABT1MVF1_9RHOB|nr:LysR family transcriptional regulator [Paracoccus albicereus]MCQ0970831.1 LysR family transcriptional regulator [Paracoccus albicereus]